MHTEMWMGVEALYQKHCLAVVASSLYKKCWHWSEMRNTKKKRLEIQKVASLQYVWRLSEITGFFNINKWWGTENLILFGINTSVLILDEEALTLALCKHSTSTKAG